MRPKKVVFLSLTTIFILIPFAYLFWQRTATYKELKNRPIIQPQSIVSESVDNGEKSSGLPEKASKDRKRRLKELQEKLLQAEKEAKETKTAQMAKTGKDAGVVKDKNGPETPFFPIELSESDKRVMEALKKMEEGQTEAGIMELKEILRDDPGNEMALEELGLYYLDKVKNPDEAYLYFSRLLEKNPQNPVAIHELSSLLEQTQGEESAEAFLRDLHSKNPQSTSVSGALADTLVRQGRYNEATPLYEELAKQPGATYFEWQDLAENHQRSGSYQKSAEAYERVLQGQNQELNQMREKGQPSEYLEKEIYNTKLDMTKSELLGGNCQKAKERIRELEDENAHHPELKSLYSLLDKNCP